MLINARGKSNLSLLEAQAPELVVATRGHRVLHKSEFEEVSQNKGAVVVASLVWNTNSYFVDVAEQTFVVNGGKKIRFDEHIVGEATVVLIRRHHLQLGIGDGNTPAHVVSYLLGYEGDVGNLHLFMAMHISPDGSAFRFVTKR